MSSSRIKHLVCARMAWWLFGWSRQVIDNGGLVTLLACRMEPEWRVAGPWHWLNGSCAKQKSRPGAMLTPSLQGREMKGGLWQVGGRHGQDRWRCCLTLKVGAYFRLPKL